MNSIERIFALKISLIMSVRMLGLFMLFPVMSIYASEYDNSTPFLIGMAIGIYGLTQALLQIPFGYLSDRFGRKPILVIGLIIFFFRERFSGKYFKYYSRCYWKSAPGRRSNICCSYGISCRLD